MASVAKRDKNTDEKFLMTDQLVTLLGAKRANARADALKAEARTKEAAFGGAKIKGTYVRWGAYRSPDLNEFLELIPRIAQGKEERAAFKEMALILKRDGIILKEEMRSIWRKHISDQTQSKRNYEIIVINGRLNDRLRKFVKHGVLVLERQNTEPHTAPIERLDPDRRDQDLRQSRKQHKQLLNFESISS